jgi:hypothetical protein
MDPVVLSAAAGWAEQLLGVPGAEPVNRALKVAVAELYIVPAGPGSTRGVTTGLCITSSRPR